MSAGRHSLNIVRSLEWILENVPNLGSKNQICLTEERTEMIEYRGTGVMRAGAVEPQDLGARGMNMMKSCEGSKQTGARLRLKLRDASLHPTQVPEEVLLVVQVGLPHLLVVPWDLLEVLHPVTTRGRTETEVTLTETQWCQMGLDTGLQSPEMDGGRQDTNQEPRQFLHLESQDLLQNLMLIPEGRGIAILKMEIPVIIVEATEEDQ